MCAAQKPSVSQDPFSSAQASPLCCGWPQDIGRMHLGLCDFDCSGECCKAVTCLMRSTEKAKVRGFNSLNGLQLLSTLGYDYFRVCRASAVLALLCDDTNLVNLHLI